MIPGHTFSVCRINGHDFLIGIQVATFLDRETHNIYRALRRRGVTVYRGTAADVEILVQARAVSSITKALSFLPMERTVAYIKQQLEALNSGSNSDE